MTLQPGEIFNVAIAAGLVLRGTGDKRTLCCPFHDDRHASAFVSSRNVFYCARCTPEGGWTLKRFREALGSGWVNPAPLARQRAPGAPRPKFTAADAKALWSAAFARARDDEHAAEDAAVYAYLARRGLGEAWEVGAFGILPPNWPHPAIRPWYAYEHHLLVPVHDRGGEVVGVQARSITDAFPKTLFPAGSHVTGSAFADRRGQRLLAGEAVPVVLLGEGLSDSLAYAIASPWPALAAPGTSLTFSMVGPWARDAEVLLALDADQAGEAAAGPVKDELYRHGARSVRRVRWPDGAKDACDVVEKRGIDGLHDFLASLARTEAA